MDRACIHVGVAANLARNASLNPAPVPSRSRSYLPALPRFIHPPLWAPAQV